MYLLAEAADAAAHAPPGWVTALFGGLLLCMVVALALEEKLHAKKSVITGIGAIVCLLAGQALDVLPEGPALLQGHELHLPIYVAAIDWEVIAIILGASLFVDVTSKSGIFTWIAVKLTKLSRGDPRRLLWFYGALTVAFSAFLNNVTAMIIVGSLTAVSLKRLKLQGKLLGFLFVYAIINTILMHPRLIGATQMNASLVHAAMPFGLVLMLRTLAVKLWRAVAEMRGAA